MDISRDIRGYYIIIFPEAGAQLQSAQVGATEVDIADQAEGQRGIRDNPRAPQEV